MLIIFGKRIIILHFMCHCGAQLLSVLSNILIKATLLNKSRLLFKVLLAINHRLMVKILLQIANLYQTLFIAYIWFTPMYYTIFDSLVIAFNLNVRSHVIIMLVAVTL